MAQHSQAELEQIDIPGEVFEFAAEHQLGMPVAEYRVKFSRPLFFGSFVIALLILFVWFFHIVTFDFRDQFTLTCLAGNFVFLLLAVGFYLALPILFRRERLYVCNNGVLQVTQTKERQRATVLLRWEQIAEVWRSGLHPNRYRPLEFVPIYIVILSNRTQREIGDVFLNVKALGTTIEHEVVKRYLPRALETYHTGDAVTFGKLSIDQSGIWKGKNNFLSWSQVESMKIKTGGIVFLKRKGKRRKHIRLSFTDIPNACVLEVLIEYIFQERKGIDTASDTRLLPGLL